MQNPNDDDLVLAEDAEQQLHAMLTNIDAQDFPLVFGWKSKEVMPFPRLAHRMCAGSVDGKTKFIDCIVMKYFASPFNEAIAEALHLLEAPDIQRFFTGVNGYMLASFYDAERWKPYMAATRSGVLIMDVDVFPALAEGIATVIDLEFGERGVRVDLTPGDSGAAGLIHALAFLPDFIISDFTLIGLNGFEMLWYLSLHPKTKGILYTVLTALDQSDLIASALEVSRNARHYIHKPFDAEDFIAAVQDHLDQLNKA